MIQKFIKLKKNILDQDHGKCITTHKINNLTLDNFAAISKEVNLASKNDIADFVKNRFYDQAINLTKTVALNKRKLVDC